MNEKQYQNFLATFIKDNSKATAEAIEIHVNGKIRVMDAKLTEHIADEKAFTNRMEPIVKLYEDNLIIKEKVETYGERTIFWSKVVTSIGIIVASIIYAFNHVKL